MLKRYLISDTDAEFAITKNSARAKANFYIMVLLVIVWYAAVIGSHKSQTSNVVYLFHLVPILLIPRGLKYLKVGFSSVKIIFSKNTKTIDTPDKGLVEFKAIRKVVIEYPNKNEIDECSLNLILLDGRRIEIDRSDANFNSEVIQTAKSIAQILGVTLEDNHPYKEQL